ncbi:MAG: DUF4124 domain-containing protein [Gammaproteobacteria bacterium]|nr:DUF4124 domain-containing protein [Gammaproteobacteria bacterium]
MLAVTKYTYVSLKKIPVLLVAATLCIAAGAASAGALYKWIDEDGQVRYSDRLPVKQVKKKHQQLNSQGVVVGTTEAAMSEEELAAEAEANRKAEELAKEDARLKDIQYKKDQVLLLTFSSEKELALARDDRLEVLESVIRLITKSIDSNQQTLKELETTAEENYTSQGNEVPGGLAQKIEHFTSKIESRTDQLLLKIEEKDRINGQFELDLARFRELTSAETD